MFILKISLVKSFYALVIYKYCVLVLILFFFVWSYDIFLLTYSYDISNEDILNQQFFIINFIFNNKKKHSLIILYRRFLNYILKMFVVCNDISNINLIFCVWTNKIFNILILFIYSILKLSQYIIYDGTIIIIKIIINFYFIVVF